MNNWNYDGNFLEAFEQKRRSLISNMFCAAVRIGAKTIDEVLEVVTVDAQERIGMGTGHWEGEDKVIAALNNLLLILDTGEARRYAEFIIKRESLSYEEKAKLKRESGADYVKAAMQEQPPSEKQLSFLKSLGCETVPQTKFEASELINKYLERKKVS